MGTHYDARRVGSGQGLAALCSGIWLSWRSEDSVVWVRRGSAMIELVEVVAQWVRTSWTKESRGGVAAARRNAVPVAFVLPQVTPPLVQEVLVDEREGFQPRSSVRRGEPGAADVLLREGDGLLRVAVVAVPFGMPQRRRRPPAVRLKPGEWLRWLINYRFVGSRGSQWWYRLDTLNLAYGHVMADLFLGKPTHQVDERDRLR